MSWLTSSPSALAIVAAKAALMYVTALLGLRLGERRTVRLVHGVLTHRCAGSAGWTRRH